MLKLQ